MFSFKKYKDDLEKVKKELHLVKEQLHRVNMELIDIDIKIIKVLNTHKNVSASPAQTTIEVGDVVTIKKQPLSPKLSVLYVDFENKDVECIAITKDGIPHHLKLPIKILEKIY